MCLFGSMREPTLPFLKVNAGEGMYEKTKGAHTRASQAKRGVRRRLLVAMLWGFWVIAGACNYGAPTTPVIESQIQITFVTPAEYKLYLAKDDAQADKAQLQTTIEVKLEKAPEDSLATLTTNGQHPVTLKVDGTTVRFVNYTLLEGENHLQVTVTTDSSDSKTSDLLRVYVDTECYKVQIVEPLGKVSADEDEDPDTAGIQKTIQLQISPTPVPGEVVSLTVSGGGGADQTLRFPLTGTLTPLEKVTLPTGTLSLTARIQDLVGNTCEDKIEVQVEPPKTP